MMVNYYTDSNKCIESEYSPMTNALEFAALIVSPIIRRNIVNPMRLGINAPPKMANIWIVLNIINVFLRPILCKIIKLF